ncbi:MAG: bacterial Ig-like domain-containing protein, partial [Lachnospira sp.]
GDAITEITLTPSTTALTENGTISISGVKIENTAGKDVTGNYDIATVNGTLKIVHDTTLAPERIEAVKVKTAYMAGDTLNVDDLTVTAYYEDGYSEDVTGYTTNASAIDMSTVGDKTLTISYTENGTTVTKDITITVSHNTTLAPERIEAVKVKTAYMAG